jgi:hypothetical protein
VKNLREFCEGMPLTNEVLPEKSDSARVPMVRTYGAARYM